jgi:large subunit ribosomal protein L11
VEITVEPKTKSFDIAVGTPPTSGLILKELGLEKGSGHSQKTKVGDLTMEQVINIVKKKHAGLLGSNLRKAANEVLGTCMSMGVTVDGKHAKEVQKLINEGGYKELFD